jgi:peptide/nickel transport system substrate-binding protein
MSKVRFLVLIVVALGLLVPAGVMAQDPGSGGPIIEGNIGGSVNFGSLNPLRSNDTATNRITAMMFPSVVGASVITGNYALFGEEGAINDILGLSYEVSEDGLTYTFKLRDDAFWSDGTPITATDVKFSFDAIASGVIDAPLYGYYNYVEGNEVGIQEVRIVDDYTVEMVYGQAGCTSLGLAGFAVVPAHAFGYDGSPDFDFASLVDNPFDTEAPIAYGPFQLASFAPGEAVALKPVTDWAEGTVIPSGFVYRDVPDQTVLVEQFLAGELNFIDRPPAARRADIRAAEGIQYRDFEAGTAWDYIGLNLADPDNPQPGRDADGNPIDQGHHPIFGDVRVRRALQMAINVGDIVQGAVFGEGTQMSANLVAGSWAHDTSLEPVPFDTEGARALLDEAGWVSTGDPLVEGGDGQRTCSGCMYAEEGTPFSFELITNAGNTRREAIGLIVKDTLAKLGINVDFQALDFQVVIDATFGAQTFDAMILGWSAGFPDDPDQLQLFGSSNDDPANQASNHTSYYSEDFERLSNEALEFAICNDPAARAEIYHQIERVLQADQPYIWLYSQNAMHAASADIEGWDSQAYVPMFNIQSWAAPAAE